MLPLHSLNVVRQRTLQNVITLLADEALKMKQTVLQLTFASEKINLFVYDILISACGSPISLSLPGY